MASRQPAVVIAPAVGYRLPRNWRALPGSSAALGDEAWRAWARDYLAALDESPEADLGDADGSAERLPYPLTLIRDELARLEAALGGRAGVHAFGSGRAMARLYIVAPDPACAQDVTAAVLRSLASRIDASGLLGPNQDLEYFEVDVENDEEGGAALILIWPNSRILAYARAAEHEDATTALAGIELADYKVNIRKALAEDDG